MVMEVFTGNGEKDKTLLSNGGADTAIDKRGFVDGDQPHPIGIIA